MPAAAELTLAVVVPTFRRPHHLTNCLKALSAQTRRPERVIVSMKVGDIESAEVIHAAAAEMSWLDWVESPASANFVDQLNAGIGRTTQDIVALMDDDAAPYPDWSERLLSRYDADDVGGVGGRDWQEDDQRNLSEVGKLRWWGKVVGNHHVGAGPVRDVDVLKGVNMSFRGHLLRRRPFDSRYRGKGNVTNTEIGLCLTLRRHSWRLRYDPAVLVRHDCAPRMDGDPTGRGGNMADFHAAKYAMAVHNETFAVLEYLALWQRPIYLAWAIFVGTRAAPGFLQIVRLISIQKRLVPPWQRFTANVRGRFAGLMTYVRTLRELRPTLPRPTSARDGGQAWR